MITDMRVTNTRVTNTRVTNIVVSEARHDGSQRFAVRPGGPFPSWRYHAPVSTVPGSMVPTVPVIC
ncbi:hypothetical protein GCM10017779_05910 [Streptomyces capillispiralis]|nr:hypothetical protein GCM10017779_05910 [Streptomyces capillispiralis]